ncbi:O-antigen ligase family protein [Gottfriedia sp. NPDC058432]|uniref:O-antigen ligase family protein n=1 Tax=Gottfriedia sp. NPDC058432 TaxID=3346497 RepID=UPI0036659E27
MSNKLVFPISILVGIGAAILSINFNLLIFFIGLIFLVLIFIKKEFFFIGLILSVDNILYLVSNDLGEKINLFFSFSVLFLIISYLIRANSHKLNTSLMNFKFPIILFILLVMVEPLNSYYLYDQPILLGIKATKWYLVVLTYILVSYLLVNNLISKRKIENIIIYIGFIAACVYITQFVMYDKIQFLNVNFLERFGEVRFYQGVNIVILSLFMSFNRLITGKNVSLIMILICITNLFYIIIVANSRTLTIPIMVAIMFIFIIQRKFNRYIVFCLAVISFFYFFILNENNLLKSIFTLLVEDISNKSGTFDVRLHEIEFYLTEVFKSPILGRGLLIESHYPSYIALGKQMEYFLSDVGIIGFFFKFGLVGLMIIFSLIVLMIKNIKYLRKNHISKFDFIGYFIYLLISIWFVPLFDNTGSLLCLAFVLSLIDYEVLQIKLRSTK